MDIRYLKKIEKRLFERTTINSFDKGSKFYTYLLERGFSVSDIEYEDSTWRRMTSYDTGLPSYVEIYGYRHMPDFNEIQTSIRQVAREYIHKQWVYKKMKNVRKRSKGLVLGRKKEF